MCTQRERLQANPLSLREDTDRRLPTFTSVCPALAHRYLMLLATEGTLREFKAVTPELNAVASFRA